MIDDGMISAWQEGSKHPVLKLHWEGSGFNICEQSVLIDLATATAEKNMAKRLLCVDDRLPSAEHLMDIALPGSGVLLPVSEFSLMLERCLMSGVGDYTFHPGCGALKTFMFRQGIITEDPRRNEELADEINGALANIFTRYGGRISMLPLVTEHHYARMIIVCQNFLLHNWRLRHWPQHFLYHGPAFGFSRRTIGDDLRLMAGICFGGHGFGDLFSEESPLLILIIGNDRESAETLAWTTTEELHRDLKRIAIKAWWPGY